MLLTVDGINYTITCGGGKGGSSGAGGGGAGQGGTIQFLLLC